MNESLPPLNRNAPREDGIGADKNAVDAQLQQAQARIAPIYARLPLVEPDRELDARIRAIAQRALGQHVPPQNLRASVRKHRSRWVPALSAAAVLMLTAGLTWRAVPQLWTERSTVQGTQHKSETEMLGGQAAAMRASRSDMVAPEQKSIAAPEALAIETTSGSAAAKVRSDQTHLQTPPSPTELSGNSADRGYTEPAPNAPRRASARVSTAEPELHAPTEAIAPQTKTAQLFRAAPAPPPATAPALSVAPASADAEQSISATSRKDGATFDSQRDAASVRCSASPAPPLPKTVTALVAFVSEYRKNGCLDDARRVIREFAHLHPENAIPDTLRDLQ